MLRSISLSPTRAYSLETSSVYIEKYPLIVKPVEGLELRRIDDEPAPPSDDDPEFAPALN